MEFLFYIFLALFIKNFLFPIHQIHFFYLLFLFALLLLPNYLLIPQRHFFQQLIPLQFILYFLEIILKYLNYYLFHYPLLFLFHHHHPFSLLILPFFLLFHLFSHHHLFLYQKSCFSYFFYSFYHHPSLHPPPLHPRLLFPFKSHFLFNLAGFLPYLIPQILPYLKFLHPTNLPIQFHFFPLLFLLAANLPLDSI